MKKIVLTLAVILMMTTQAFADQTGTCGENATWTLDETTGVLTVSGTGSMYEYRNPSFQSPFYCNTQIKQVVINKGITTIGSGSFDSCTELESITMPNSVTSIGKDAFSGCSKLTTIVIPNSVTTIGNGAFYLCSNLASITLSNSLESIENKAFSRCQALTSITLPASLEQIGENVFSECTGLTSIIIPESVTSLGYGAFKDCISLSSVTLPSTLETIEENLFFGCTGLTTITIPKSVTQIKSQAFASCKNLNKVYVSTAEPPSVTYNSFASSTKENGVLYVLESAYEKYLSYTNKNWQEFKTIKTFTPQEPEDDGKQYVDCNGDGQVNSTDIVAIYNYISYGTNPRAKK